MNTAIKMEKLLMLLNAANNQAAITHNSLTPEQVLYLGGTIRFSWAFGVTCGIILTLLIIFIIKAGKRIIKQIK